MVFSSEAGCDETLGEADTGANETSARADLVWDGLRVLVAGVY